MKKLLGIILILCAATTAMSQPAARRAAQEKAQQAGPTQKKSTSALSTRAQLSLPTAQKMNEDVVWRRDIYREIDLTDGNNAGLYYPVEPVGSQMNLFTYLFKLVLSGQVKAYEYRLDGNESFEKDALVKPLALLDNYHIYYERMDGRLKLDNSDIPSREVKSYYIKESSYYDQNSATFHTKVIALCPIMSREDDFGDGTAKYPLFWVKYDDAAPFLAKQTIMTSDLNNGKIYKTNNMLGQTLAQYCPTDSAMQKEQQRIEAELKAFEENIWGDKARKDSLDSIAKVIQANPKAARKAAKANRRAAGAAGKNDATGVQKKSTNRRRSSATGSSARVSVRRERH